MKKKRIQLKELQLRERQIALKEKESKKMLTLINMPCGLGGRFILQMEEGYTKADLIQVKDIIMQTIRIQCDIYKKLTIEEKEKLFL